MKISNCGLALIYLASPFVLLVSAFSIGVVTSVKGHDAQLERLKQEIEVLPHPTNSSFVARHGEIGNFGNGDHIDYWAVELRSFAGVRSTLKVRYKDARVRVPNAGEDVDDDASQGIIRGNSQ